VTDGDALDPADGTGGPAATSLDVAAGPRARRISRFGETIIFVVIALVISLTVKTYVVEPFLIPTASMEDTLLEGDKVLVNKFVGHISQIHRGDIVVFNGNGSWDPPTPVSGNPVDRIYRNFLTLFGDHSGEIDYIKRVIGLPGDRVACCNARGLMTVNGTALHETGYLYPGSEPSTTRFSVVVPPGDVWVMGDNRGDSSDSRFHHCGYPGAECAAYDRSGAVPERRVIGRAFVIVWPLSQFRMLWVPSTFSQRDLRASPVSTPAVSAAGQPGVQVVRADPGLPIAVGAIAAVPLTLLTRRLRFRHRGRR
jgi:signal peptidase I